MAMDNFWKAWETGEPGGAKLLAAFDRALQFFNIGTMWWDLRVAQPGAYDDAYMAVNAGDGNDAFFIVSDLLVNLDCRQKGRFTAAIVIHEVLEVFEWVPGQVEAASSSRKHPLRHIQVTRHAQLDKLAWTLVPHVYPDLDPEEDFFDDSTGTFPGGNGARAVLRWGEPSAGGSGG